MKKRSPVALGEKLEPPTHVGPFVSVPAGEPPMNGFVTGMRYPIGSDNDTSMSILNILPSNSAGFCARCSGSFAEPPSPIPMYR